MHKYRAQSLIPVQHKTNRRNIQKDDSYLQHGLKFGGVAIFHDYENYLHGGLLEGDVKVTSYVPYPFELQYGRTKHTPDCYYVKEGNKIVCNLLSRGEQKDQTRYENLKDFFSFNSMTYVESQKEEITRRETEALNWWRIVQVLVTSPTVNTTEIETDICDHLFSVRKLNLGDIIKVARPEVNYLREVALFRLLVRGKVFVDLVSVSLSYDSEAFI